MKGPTRILLSILFFALLFPSVQAFCATAPSGQNVTLAWIPSSDPNVVGYDVYYGGMSGDYTNMINVGNVANATVGGLTAGATYYFAATAYDSIGDQSGFSSEISYIMPATLPGLQIRAAPAGTFVLTVNGPIGQTNEILATQDFIVWTVLGTVTLGAGGTLDFTDTNSANLPQRFYRAQELP
jgi:hypothetical protein